MPSRSHGLRGSLPEAFSTEVFILPLLSMRESVSWFTRIYKGIRVVLPHVALISALVLYIVGGAIIYQTMEGYAGPRHRLPSAACNISQIGKHHEPNSWSRVESAILYSLTILTTCGFDALIVKSDISKMFTFFYGVMGIPLMFITGADIGKFLSEMVLNFDSNIFNKLYGIPRHLKNIICCFRMRPIKLPPKARSRVYTPEDLRRNSEFTLLSSAVEEQTDGHKLWFPIGSYILVLFCYCCLGSLMFMYWENDWRFVHYFHYSFLSITTVTLGLVHVENPIYLALIMMYSIVGVSIITMCMDLAGDHIKRYFEQLHYFGRRRFERIEFRRKLRRAIQRFGVRPNEEMITALEMMAGRCGGELSILDVKRYLELQHYFFRDRPYVPRGSNQWRFIDDSTTCSSWTLIRRNSITSEFIPKSWSTPEALSDKFEKFQLLDELTFFTPSKHTPMKYFP